MHSGDVMGLKVLENDGTLCSIAKDKDMKVSQPFLGYKINY